MLHLPLYKQPPSLALETEAPLDVNTSCTRCDLSNGKIRTICMRPEGEPGGLLVVGEAPGRNEDNAGRPFIGESGKMVRRALAKYWTGPVAIDNAMRCFPGREVKSKYVDACRPFLAQTFQEVRPTRIVALGSWAAYSLFGRSVSPFSTRRGYGFWRGPHGDVPIFSVIHPAAALRNRIVRSWWDADFAWALTCTPPAFPPWDANVYLVTDEKEARVAVDELSSAEWAAFDVETAGHMFDPSFRVLCLSACAKGERDPYVFTRQALVDPGARKVLLDWLRDENAKKIGSNVKYDMTSVFAEFGVMPRGVVGDVRLWRKLNEPEAEAKLDKMAELVGMGGMKEEQKDAMTIAVARVKKILAAERHYEKWQTTKQDPSTKKRKEPEYPAKLSTLGIDPDLEKVIRDPETETANWSYAVVDQDVLHRYNGRDAVATTSLGELIEPQLRSVPQLARVWDMVVSGASDAIAQVEAWGMPCSRDAVMIFDRYLDTRERDLKQRLDGYFPDVLWSSSQQIREVLFDKLKLPIIKLTDTELASTDKEALDRLKGKHPLIDLLIDYRKVGKLRGTYARGMLRHIRADGRIHPSILLDGARSGRTSCQDPNLQNIPRPGTPESKMARDCFVARDGHQLVELDFSQIELRVAAMLSGDTEMLRIFKDGVDFHQSVAETVSMMMWRVPPSQVTSEMRSQVKPLVFGKLYGKGVKSIAKDLHVQERVAAQVIDSIFGRFKRLDAWCVECLSETRRTGLTWTWWAGKRARIRPLWRIADADDEARSVAEHGSWNTPCQGTAAEFLLASLVEIVRWIQDDAVPAVLCVPVHDSVLLEVRDDAVHEVVYQGRRIMESWETANDVPLVADAKVGRAWGSMGKYKAA